MTRIAVFGLAVMAAFANPAIGQELVVPAENIEALFTSKDPKLHANKQIVYHIIRDLLEANHWDRAGDFLSEDYIQHNPNAKSGLAPVVEYFTQVLKLQPKPLPEKIGMPVVAVTAEGDLVTVLYRRTVEDSNHPDGKYTTTWYDTWRIKDEKATQHWDPALLAESPDLR